MEAGWCVVVRVDGRDDHDHLTLCTVSSLVRAGRVRDEDEEETEMKTRVQIRRAGY